MRVGAGRRALRRSLRVSSLVWLAGIGACTSLVGIEDLHEGPRAGTPGEGGDGTGARGGSKSTQAGSDSTSAAGAAEGGSAGTAGSAVGGSNEGGADTGTLGGAGGEGTGGPGTPVHGTIVDFWGHKLPNIPVQIGDTLTATDDKGQFTIDDVPAKYDVSFVTEYEFNTVPRTFGWVYQGLTRRDPTLSSIQALGPRFGDVELAAQATKAGTNQVMKVAFGGPDGSSESGTLDGTAKTITGSWEGGATSQATAHGLFWQYDGPDTLLPVSYLAVDSTALLLSETQNAKITLNLAKQANMVYGPMSGEVTPDKNSSRLNEVFLHFTSGATMTLLSDDPGPNKFSYVVPSIAGASVTLQASEGNPEYGAYGVARATGLSPTSKPALTVPTPVTLTSPSDGVTLAPTTKFGFQTLPANPGPFVVKFEDVDVNGPFQTLYVVTAAKQLTVPEVIGGGFTLHADNAFEWRVITHGKFASVDAMTGPNGFLQPYDFYNNVPYGPRQGDGEYTISGARGIQTPK